MANPPSPVHCPQLSAAALVAFDFAVWRCCFACFVAVVLVVFLYVFSRRIFFPLLLLLLLLFWLQHTQQLFVHTFAWQNNFAGPQIRNLQPVVGVAPIPLSLSLSLLLLPRMHCGFCCIIIMLRLHPLPPSLPPSTRHTEYELILLLMLLEKHLPCLWWCLGKNRWPGWKLKLLWFERLLNLCAASLFRRLLVFFQHGIWACLKGDFNWFCLEVAKCSQRDVCKIEIFSPKVNYWNFLLRMSFL